MTNLEYPIPITQSTNQPFNLPDGRQANQQIALIPHFVHNFAFLLTKNALIYGFLASKTLFALIFSLPLPTILKISPLIWHSKKKIVKGSRFLKLPLA